MTTERHKHTLICQHRHTNTKRCETKLTPAKTNLLYDVLMFVLLLCVMPSLLLIIQY